MNFIIEMLIYICLVLWTMTQENDYTIPKEKILRKDNTGQQSKWPKYKNNC